MSKLSPYLIALVLIAIPLYPKFPLLGVSGTFVSVRLEDFVLAMVVGYWVITKRLQVFKLLKSPVHRSILIYLLIGLFSLFSGIFLTKTVIPTQGLLHWLRRVEYMSLFFVGFDLLKSKQQLGFIVKTFILVSFVVAVYGLGQQFFNFPVISTTNSEFSKGLALTLGAGARINSTFAGHYDLAAYSIFPLLLILGLIIGKAKHKLLLVALAFPVYWTMLLSASRVTFAAFFVTSAIYLIFSRKYLWVIPLGFLAVVSMLFTPQLLGRYQSIITNHLTSIVETVHAQAEDDQLPDALKAPAVPEDRSLNIRLNAEWPKSLRAFYVNPVFGSGYSSVGLATDNDYLRMLAETGLLGLIAFSIIVVRILRTTLPYFKTGISDLSSVFVTSMSFGLACLLMNAVFIDVFEASKIAIMLWLLLGMVEKVKLLNSSQYE